jgi:hypothetical protein
MVDGQSEVNKIQLIIINYSYILSNTLLFNCTWEKKHGHVSYQICKNNQKNRCTCILPDM